MDINEVSQRRDDLMYERAQHRIAIDKIDKELVVLDWQINNLRYELNKREEDK